MAIVLTIGVSSSNKQFSYAKGNRVEKCTPYFVSGSGWTCRWRSDGSVSCETSEMRNGKYYETHFSIRNNGKLEITRMNGGIRTQDFICRIGKWPVDGEIVLTGGDAEKRKAYFIRNKADKQR